MNHGPISLGLPASAEVRYFLPVAVALFTFHGYGTWWPDHPRGYTTIDEGVLPTDPQMAEWYRDAAKYEAVTFTPAMQEVLIAGGYDVCHRRGWRLHAAGTDPTHGHYLISDPGYFDFIQVRDKLKNLLSLFLGRATGVAGRTWFASGGSNKRVKDRAHFDYLVNSYLPGQRGLFWKEGGSLPKLADAGQSHVATALDVRRLFGCAPSQVGIEVFFVSRGSRF